MIKILVAGYPGAMAKKAVALAQRTKDFQLTAVFNPLITKDTPLNLPENVKVLTNYSQITPGLADVWIDFTVPSVVAKNTAAAIAAGIHPVIGTSGMAPADQKQLIASAKAKHLGGLIAPNFGLSAVLLMQFAKKAAAYFPDAEVIEMHHADKLDAPSGTAIATAHAIAAGRKQAPQQTSTEKARGERIDDVPIHAVRLPGYVAHEQVLFGGPGEALTIRQDSFDRESFMSGVEVAVRKVQGLNELVIGLEQVL